MPNPNLQQIITQLARDLATSIVKATSDATIEDLQRLLGSDPAPTPKRRGRPPKNLRMATTGTLYSRPLAVQDESPAPSYDSTYSGSSGGTGLLSKLSIREQEVFDAIVHQKRTTEIARELNLSPKTVSTYKRRIHEKLNLENDAQLILYASRNGLV